jgi:hypothetical protein
MDGSNSSSKKIVFKKGVLAPKNESEEAAQAEAHAQAEAAVQAESANPLYEGEIFDQFYRPLSATGGIEKLREIALTCSGISSVQPRLTRSERQERDAKHQELAEALAHQIYHLAQKVRETEIDLYLSACNVVLGDKSPQDAKAILDRANEFFTEQYYTLIRDRGERPEISHQIIKRVGHDIAERITRIVVGLDVEKVAEQLWELSHGPYPDKESRIADILLDCTEAQVRAIRDEFMLIPYKSLARQAHAILTSQHTEVKPAAKKSIGKGEVYEQKKQAAFKARDDQRALRYLFLGRSVDEMALIKRFYLELGDSELTDDELSLEAQVQKRFSQADLERLGSLLDGWSPQQEAYELHALLYPHAGKNELDDELSDPRDVVDRDHTQGIGPFLRRFKKRRMWRDKSSVYHRVLNAFELVAERIAALTPDQFIATNQALFESHAYELDPTMFPSLSLFDPRRVAVQIAERLEVAGDFFEIIAPLHFAGPRESQAVQQAYQVLYGRSLVDAVNERLSSVSELSAAYRAAHIERYIHGQGRVALSGDILARYRGDAEKPGVWQWEYRSSDADEEAAIQLAGVMDHEGPIGTLDKPVRDLLRERSYDELNRIERAFYDLTDPQMPLREALKNCLSQECYEIVELLLNGVDVKATVARLHELPHTTLALRDLPPSQIRVLRKAFEQTHFVSLEQLLLNRFEASEHEDTLIENLAIVLTPEVFETRVGLLRLSRAFPDQIDFFREQIQHGISKTMAFERSYDTQFPRLRVHLKLAAAKLAISPVVFAELMLLAEGVDPEVTQRILEYFDAVDIDTLLATLRHYKRDQGIIEEAYDLIYPDAPLKRSIKEMKVDLDYINETLLHLEGYSAKEVAEELHAFMSDLSGEKLGEAILTVLAAPTPQRPNARIPDDINWMDEMVYQIGLAYQRQFRQDIIDACRAAAVPDHQLEALTQSIYGMEVCASARELFNLLKANKEGALPPEHAEQRICSYIESRGARYRARFIRAYNSYWAHQPGFESLLDDVSKFMHDSGIRKKLHTLLLGVGAEFRGAAKGGSVIIQ